jgi:hypothetical protein
MREGGGRVERVVGEFDVDVLLREVERLRIVGGVEVRGKRGRGGCFRSCRSLMWRGHRRFLSYT